MWVLSWLGVPAHLNPSIGCRGKPQQRRRDECRLEAFLNKHIFELKVNDSHGESMIFFNLQAYIMTTSSQAGRYQSQLRWIRTLKPWQKTFWTCMIIRWKCGLQFSAISTIGRLPVWFNRLDLKLETWDRVLPLESFSFAWSGWHELFIMIVECLRPDNYKCPTVTGKFHQAPCHEYNIKLMSDFDIFICR